VRSEGGRRSTSSPEKSLLEKGDRQKRRLPLVDSTFLLRRGRSRSEREPSTIRSTSVCGKDPQQNTTMRRTYHPVTHAREGSVVPAARRKEQIVFMLKGPVGESQKSSKRADCDTSDGGRKKRRRSSRRGKRKDLGGEEGSPTTGKEERRNPSASAICTIMTAPRGPRQKKGKKSAVSNSWRCSSRGEALLERADHRKKRRGNSDALLPRARAGGERKGHVSGRGPTKSRHP